MDNLLHRARTLAEAMTEATTGEYWRINHEAHAIIGFIARNFIPYGLKRLMAAHLGYS
jgi:hypothetical protein